jgi:hypothetical protein
VLAAFIGSDAGPEEGHFRVDRLDDGWRIWSTMDDIFDRNALELPATLAASELSSVAVERFRRYRFEYSEHFGRGLRPPFPMEAFMIRLDHWAELVATSLRGTLAPSGTPGFDVEAPNEGRVQIKCSVRNKKSGVISTLTFKSDPSYFNHDHLAYVVFDEDRFPVSGWIINSDVFRSMVPHDHKSHQVEKIMITHGAELTDVLQTAPSASATPPRSTGRRPTT